MQSSPEKKNQKNYSNFLQEKWPYFRSENHINMILISEKKKKQKMANMSSV